MTTEDKRKLIERYAKSSSNANIYTECINTEFDSVEKPKHYTEGGIECIDAMLQIYGKEAVKDFCLCNAFKYLWRCKKKHETPIEDIKKAKWYIAKYIELEDEQ